MMTDRRRKLANQIGQHIKELRLAKGWSQERLAREMEMSRETIRAAESGERIPDWPTLERFAIALGVDFPILLGDLVTLDKLSRLRAARVAVVA